MDTETCGILENVLAGVNSEVIITPFMIEVENEIDRIDDDLISLDDVSMRNKQRKRRRLIAKKEKMKVKLQLAIRDVYNEDISPNERRSLQYYSRKFESDGEFLERKLCTELGLTYADWDSYCSTC